MICPNCRKPGKLVETWTAQKPGEPIRVHTRYQCPDVSCRLKVFGGKCAGKNGSFRFRTWDTVDGVIVADKLAVRC